MKYYVIYDENGKASTIGCGDSLGGAEIAEQEYNALSAEIRAKTAYVNKVFTEEIAIEDVPAEWREEIQQRVDARIQAVAEAKEMEEALEEDYLSALARLGVEE